MNFLQHLKTSSSRFMSIVCLGLDPVLEDIPEKGLPKEKIFRFYENILNAIIRSRVFPAAVKPNYAFYAQYGIEGIESLKGIITLYQKEGFPVILDAKRGDIDKTARAYAREAFEFFGADAVTLSPYLGFDAISPFTDDYPDKGFYILTKTSNKSSGEIQDLDAGGEPVYMKVARKIVEWNRPGLASVAGATYPDDLLKISEIFIASEREIPLLIPGVGAQGGSLEETLGVLKRFPDPRIHRINSSSAINYAYKKHPGHHYADAAVSALKELNENIGDLI